MEWETTDADPSEVSSGPEAPTIARRLFFPTRFSIESSHNLAEVLILNNNFFFFLQIPTGCVFFVTHGISSGARFASTAEHAGMLLMKIAWIGKRLRPFHLQIQPHSKKQQRSLRGPKLKLSSEASFSPRGTPLNLLEF
jgi:hypothetical protein